MNFVDMRRGWRHHAVMRRVWQELRHSLYQVEPDWITELSGLRVPVAYDCAQFGAKKHPKNEQDGKRIGALDDHFDYFNAVPQRWQACLRHHSMVLAGQKLQPFELPWVDEEYHEELRVYESVLNARKQYSLIEVGARWGTWSLRALALLRRLRPEVEGQTLLFEVRHASCEAIEVVSHANGLTPNVTVICEPGNAELICEWVEQRGYVDVVDLDIQGAEFDVVPAILSACGESIGRFIVGTHNGDHPTGTHTSMLELFLDRGWKVVNDFAFQGSTYCTHLFRRGPETRWADQDRLLDACWVEQTAQGPVVVWDGELIVDNPAPPFAVPASGVRAGGDEV